MAVLELAEEDGVDLCVFREILWLIAAQCHLLALTRTASTLLDIFRLTPPQ